MLHIERIFNRVKNYLLAQNEQSLDSQDRCMYRGDDCRKCAVGFLISDEFYTPKLERKSLRHSQPIREAVMKSQKMPDIPRVWEMLHRLQLVHDHNEPRMWEMLIDDIEKEFVLCP